MARFVFRSMIFSIIATMTSSAMNMPSTAAGPISKYESIILTILNKKNNANDGKQADNNNNKTKMVLLPLGQLQSIAASFAQMMGNTDVSDHDAVRDLCPTMPSSILADISAALAMDRNEVTISLEDMRRLEALGISGLFSSCIIITDDTVSSDDDHNRASKHSPHNSVSSNASTLVDITNDMPDWMQSINLDTEAVATKSSGGLKVIAGFIEHNGRDVGVTNKWHEKKLNEVTEDFEDDIEVLKTEHHDEITILKKKLDTAHKLRENGKAKIVDLVSTNKHLSITEVAQTEEINNLTKKNDALQADNSKKDITIRTLQQDVRSLQAEVTRKNNMLQNYETENQELRKRLDDERTHIAVLLEQAQGVEAQETQGSGANNSNQESERLANYYRQKATEIRKQYENAAAEAQRTYRAMETEIRSVRRDAASMEHINQNTFRRQKEQEERADSLAAELEKFRAENQELVAQNTIYRDQVTAGLPSVHETFNRLKSFVDQLTDLTTEPKDAIPHANNGKSIKDISTEMKEFYDEARPMIEACKTSMEKNAKQALDTMGRRREILELNLTVKNQSKDLKAADERITELEMELEFEKADSDTEKADISRLNHYVELTRTLEEKVTDLEGQLFERWENAAPTAWRGRFQELRVARDQLRAQLQEIQSREGANAENLEINNGLAEQLELVNGKLTTMENHYRVAMSENNKLRDRLGMEVVPSGVDGITPTESKFMGLRMCLIEGMNPEEVPEVQEEELRGEYEDRRTSIDREPTTAENIALGVVDRMANMWKAILADEDSPAGVPLPEQGPDVNEPLDLSVSAPGPEREPPSPTLSDLPVISPPGSDGFPEEVFDYDRDTF
ncbi:uncharacterized protein K452DRAFT_331747 [Aplosporella prunicola CBS 121167]|uniref:HOOK N-terminal domain-containing protein n=1 Tax=Aplosporella prunicola CBS 121167 TaxID=1176127 RepID=A0A6A6BG69_9PEZI|nr:uncharacterized protein K452DRAFT_331747 [Aplosporella prunicola CBS 121167]KAF2143076.1 hypothetical protein K452DRAFT_331747 [Aplosporella prunicola CBS 121167]